MFSPPYVRVHVAVEQSVRERPPRVLLGLVISMPVPLWSVPYYSAAPLALFPRLVMTRLCLALPCLAR